MLKLKTPNNIETFVPENPAEDNTPKFQIDNNNKILEAKRFYDENGYVIIRNIFSKKVCDTLRNFWQNEIKSYEGKIYRQTTSSAEVNHFNKNNWVMNPILNIQSLNPKYFSGFRNYADQNIFSYSELCKILFVFFDEKPKFVQSMYFEGNSATWEHQDTYYLDSEIIGSMIAGWIALEDISVDAGRFFVCPLSNKIDLIKQVKINNYAYNHDRYIHEVVSLIKEKNLKIIAPYLEKGDVLFWNSKTIHGSLDSQSKSYSRSSITFHAIPESHRFLQFQSRIKNIKTNDLGESLIFRPKDQSKLKNRMIFEIETTFPKIFYFFKKKLINNLIK